MNGHIESKFSNGQWSAPTFVRSPYLAIHGLAPALNYGVQAFEGLKAFRHASTGEITIFRPQKNAQRLQKSAEAIRCPLVPEDLFLRAVNLAVATNAEFVPPLGGGGAALYIRPLIYGSSPQLALKPSDEYTFAVFVMPVGVYHGATAADALIVEDFDRAAPHGTGSVKVGGNYAPVFKHSENAHKEGFGITLHLDSASRSEIDEFSTSGFIGVRRDDNDGKVTLLVPDSNNVLDSVTSQSVCHIARDHFGFNLEKRRIPYAELSQLKEVFAAGTAAVLLPIRSISRKSTGDKFEFDAGPNGEGGEVLSQLVGVYKGIQQGTLEDKYGWRTTVEAAPEGFASEQ